MTLTLFSDYLFAGIETRFQLGIGVQAGVIHSRIKSASRKTKSVMRNFLRTKGLKMTPQRECIFRAFYDRSSPVTVEELCLAVRSKDPEIGYSTVWRTLKLICDIGLGEKKYFSDGLVRYDKLTSEKKGQMSCQICGSTKEFPLADVVERALRDVADESGLVPEAFRVEIEGICLLCRESARNGKKESVIDITVSERKGKAQA